MCEGGWRGRFCARGHGELCSDPVGTNVLASFPSVYYCNLSNRLYRARWGGSGRRRIRPLSVVEALRGNEGQVRPRSGCGGRKRSKGGRVDSTVATLGTTSRDFSFGVPEKKGSTDGSQQRPYYLGAARTPRYKKQGRGRNGTNFLGEPREIYMREGRGAI